MAFLGVNTAGPPPDDSGNWWESPDPYGGVSTGVPKDIQAMGLYGQGLMSGAGPGIVDPTMAQYAGGRGLVSSGVAGAPDAASSLAPYQAVDQPQLQARAKAAERMAAVRQKDTGSEMALGSQEWAANQRLLNDAIYKRKLQNWQNMTQAGLNFGRAMAGSSQAGGSRQQAADQMSDEDYWNKLVRENPTMVGESQWTPAPSTPYGG